MARVPVPAPARRAEVQGSPGEWGCPQLEQIGVGSRVLGSFEVTRAVREGTG
jgi:hypothetical protein